MVRMLEYALKSMTRNPGGRLDRCVRWDRWEGGGAGAGATGAPEAECKGRPLRNQRMLSGGSPSSMTHEICTRALIITWGMWNGLIRGAAGFRPENSGIFFSTVPAIGVEGKHEGKHAKNMQMKKKKKTGECRTLFPFILTRVDRWR